MADDGAEQGKDPRRLQQHRAGAPGRDGLSSVTGSHTEALTQTDLDASLKEFGNVAHG